MGGVRKGRWWLVVAGLALVVGCSTEPGDDDTGDDDLAGDDDTMGDDDSAGAPGACQGLSIDEGASAGPVYLLDEPHFADALAAGTAVDPAAVEVQTLEVLGVPLTVLRFSFRSSPDVYGVEWWHEAALLLPPEAQLAAGDVLAVNGAVGTLNAVGPGAAPDPIEGEDYPAWFAGTGDVGDYLRTFASVPAELGVPLMVFNDAPGDVELPPEVLDLVQAELMANDDPCDDGACQGLVTEESAVHACMNLAVRATGDLAMEAGLNIAFAYRQAVDAAAEAANGWYEGTGSATRLEPARVWSIGASKRGNAQRLFAAIDGRVDGALVAAADLGNFPIFLDLQFALWEGYYSFSAEANAPYLQTGDGLRFLDAFDPVRWSPDVLGDRLLVVAVGTNDALFPLPSLLVYRDGLSADHRVVMVPGYGHGHGTVDHLRAWRGLIRHRLEGVPWTQVEAAWNPDTALVSVDTAGASPLALQLWCATSLADDQETTGYDESCQPVDVPELDDADLRDAAWEVVDVPLTGEPPYTVEAPASALGYPACIVRLLDEQQMISTSGPLLSAPLCEAAGLAPSPLPASVSAGSGR